MFCMLRRVSFAQASLCQWKSTREKGWAPKGEGLAQKRRGAGYARCNYKSDRTVYCILSHKNFLSFYYQYYTMLLTTNKFVLSTNER